MASLQVNSFILLNLLGPMKSQTVIAVVEKTVVPSLSVVLLSVISVTHIQP